MGQRSEPIVWSVKDLALVFGQQDLEVIDVRGLDFFLGYIPASRRCPCELFDKERDRLAGELAESGKTLVFVDKVGGAYATNCARVFLRHVDEHFSRPTCRVCVLAGGFSSWEAHFAGHQESGRHIARAPNFPGAPYRGLLPFGSSQCPSPAPSSCPSLPSLSRSAHSGRRSHSQRTPDDARPLDLEPARAPDGELSGSLTALPAPSIGDLVWVLSRTAAGWLQACVVARDGELVKVQYFLRGKCCFKVLPTTSTNHCLTLQG